MGCEKHFFSLPIISLHNFVNVCVHVRMLVNIYTTLEAAEKVRPRRLQTKVRTFCASDSTAEI